MINFVDEVLNTASTSGKVKYNVKHSNGTSEVVEITLATPVTTQGTPLNKALFDSIKNDLNSRLLSNNKATTNDVIAGTNNTKYVTPQSLNSLITLKNKIYTSSQTSVQTDTIITFGSNIGRMHIDGWLRGFSTTASGEVLPANGAVVLYVNYNNGSEIRIAGSTGSTASHPDTEGFKIEIDFNTKQFYIKGNDYYYTNVGSQYTLHTIEHDNYVQFDSIENITIKGKYGAGDRGYMIAVYRDL